jgi:hypothetical protein
MSDRKLRLVPPPAEAPGAADEPPFGEDELREAEALRDALEGDPLAEALRAAWAPEALSADDVDAIVARSLGDEDAPPTAAERREADALRDALDGRGEVADAELAGALRAAARPKDLDAATNAALVERALARRPSRSGAPSGARAIRVLFAAATAVTAMAAGFALFMTSNRAAPEPSAASVAAPPSLIPARSASELFDLTEPFPRTGGESARIDRIASARTADLRANRFASWGVR